LPITRVKRIIKQDGEVKAVSTDANYAIAKAAVSYIPGVMCPALPRVAAVSLKPRCKLMFDYQQ
jgi:histone H3/H4